VQIRCRRFVENFWKEPPTQEQCGEIFLTEKSLFPESAEDLDREALGAWEHFPQILWITTQTFFAYLEAFSCQHQEYELLRHNPLLFAGPS
jgi:hypothetical protein